MKANEIKIIFIKWLLEQYPKSTIGNEVLFSINQCRADILQLLNNKTYAYEIKSDSDNLENINEQLNNYLETFDYTYLVITPKYTNNQIDTIDENVGIYLINKDNQIKKIKNAKRSKKIKKSNLLCFLPKRELIELISKKGISAKSVFELRKMCEKIAINIIKEKSEEVLYKRYSKLLNLFLYDTNGENITVDDLTSLTGNLQTDELR